jgi:hypothetical protein
LREIEKARKETQMGKERKNRDRWAENGRKNRVDFGSREYIKKGRRHRDKRARKEGKGWRKRKTERKGETKNRKLKPKTERNRGGKYSSQTERGKWKERKRKGKTER